MLIRKALFVGVFALTAICMAQNSPLYATHGRGVAVNIADQRARFSFEAVKPREGDVRGQFSLETRNENAAISINSRVLRLAVNVPRAEFVGPAVLVIANRNTGPIRVEGSVVVNVADNRRNNTGNTPDVIRVRFTGGTRVWEFGGTVREGDLAVIDNR